MKGIKMATRTTKIIPNDDKELTLSQLEQLSHFNQNQQLQPVNELTDDLDEKDDLDLLNDVMSELGGASDVKVNVYLLESGKGMAFVGSYAPDTFSIDAIQASYGAGEYSVQVRQGGRIRSRRVIRIAKPRENVQLNTNPQFDMISTMREQFENAQKSMLDTLKMMIPQQPVKSTTDVLNELMLMKQIMGNDAPKSGLDMKDFLTMLEVAKGLVPAQGEASTNDILMEAVKGIAPVLMGGMTQPRQQMPAQIPQRVQPVPIPLNNPIENPLETPQPIQEPVLNSKTNEANLATESEIDVSLQEKMFFNLLIRNAQNDNDPEPYANMLLDIVGSDTAEKLLNDPRWFDALINKDPRCQSYEAWFNELRNAILDIIANEKNILTDNNGTDINGVTTVQTDNTDATSEPKTL